LLFVVRFLYKTYIYSLGEKAEVIRVKPDGTHSNQYALRC